MGHFAGKPVAVALKFDQRYCYLPFIVMASPCLASAAEESLDPTSRSAAVLTTAAQPSQQADLAQVSPEQLTHDLAFSPVQLQLAVLAGVAPTFTMVGLMVPPSGLHSELSYRAFSYCYQTYDTV